MLYLHGNAISDISSVENMSSSTSLSILTLYDSPVALLQNYRHRVVNGLWSLKALDHFIIADEEIIEETEFGGRFSAMTKNFKHDLYQYIPFGCTHKEGNQIVKLFVRRVSSLHAYNSPVITIQKWIRGCLVRRQTSSVRWQRCKAAVTIQQAYRQYKNIKIPVGEPLDSSELSQQTPFPSSPTPNYEQYYLHRPISGSSTCSYSARSSRLGSRQKRNRVILKRIEKNISEKAKLDEMEMADISTSPRYLLTKVSPTIKRISKSLLQPSDEKDDLLVMAEKRLAAAEGKSQRAKPKSKKTTSMLMELDRCSSPVKCENRGVKYEDDVELDVTIRLPVIQTQDPIEDIMMSKRQAGREGRVATKAADKLHSSIPKPNITKSEQSANDQILIDHIQTMSLACLSAVDKAYHKQKKAQERETKVQWVRETQRAHIQATDENKAKRRQKQMIIAKQKAKEKKQLVRIRRELDDENQRIQEDAKTKRSNEHRHEEDEKQERAFIQDFQQQQLSVGQALVKHDLHTIRDQHAKVAQTRTHKSRQENREQQDTVKTFMEHRQLQLANRSAIEKAQLSAYLLREANQSLLEARRRVSRERSRRKAIHREADALFPLPYDECVPSVSSNVLYLDLPNSKQGERSILYMNKSKYRRDSSLAVSL